MSYPSLKIRGITVAQAPNPPLLVAIVAAVIGNLADHDGDLYDWARAVFYVALTVWAWEEMTDGVNRFRRGLGVVALAYIVYALARAFG